MCHFLLRIGAFGSRAWMISGNPFNGIGAVPGSRSRGIDIPELFQENAL
jgi:hypothetical protein